MIKSFLKMTIEYVLLICEKTGVAVATLFAAAAKHVRFAYSNLFGDAVASIKKQVSKQARLIKIAGGGVIGVARVSAARIRRAFRGFTGKNAAYRVVNLAMPFLAVAAILWIATSFNNVTLAYEMKYSGRTVGYALDEQSATKALDIANSRVSGNSQMTEKPEICVTLVSSDKISSADALSRNIIRTSNEVYDGVGVYVNDVFLFAVDSSEIIDNALENVCSSAKAASGTDNAEIIDDIKTESGLFCEGDFVDEDSAEKQLMSGAISIKTVKVEKIKETIKHKTVTAKDNTKSTNYRRVLVKGEDGITEKTVTTEYINGVKQNSVTSKAVVVKSAVDEQVVVGTRKISTTVKVIASERMSWPLNGGYISQYFGATDTNPYGHTGLDIAANWGTPIYSASSGTVTEVVYSNSGYGNRFKVDCGNGIVLLYAHCSEINVAKGDVVNAGEMIATVGSTGNSTGPHLHFEVRKNGAKVDPSPYLGLK
ncbi:MAG: peptidoglycan DD-metalloendopeptidase family protein [Acutalibacteraceae bacterium]|nr:peptidoglycan DD-metalloendopeptidase family protein [Acutalibacteraceae bacterium]